MMSLRRTLTNAFKKVNQQFPVVLIVGPRQVGKTTFYESQLGQERQSVSLDDPLLRELAQNEPKLFLQRFAPPVLIDEIQYAPQLLPYIKMAVDKNKQPGQFWLTGSQQFHLMNGVSESLAGRVGILNLQGLSSWELQGQGERDQAFVVSDDVLLERSKLAQPQTLTTLYQRIWRGSFPAIAINAEVDRDIFYSSYLQTYLQRDVKDLTQVANETQFIRFIKVAAARTGQLLNYSDIARDSDISVNTAKHWLSILQSSGLVYLLQPYFNNMNKRLIKAPKLYFLDTGLCSYLAEWSSAATLETGAMSGHIFETYVFSELLKSYWHNGKQAPFYYYRDKDGNEIDVLIKQDNTLYPIEIKKTSQPKKELAKQFRVLEREKSSELGLGGIIAMVDHVLPLTDNVITVPAWCV